MPDDPDQTADLTQQPGPTPPTPPTPPSARDRSGSHRRPGSGSGTGSGTGSDHPNRLDPGQLVAGRFRIVAFLGRGGMGEVYRADDLELGQSVALKLLPARISADPVLADRVRDEVRVARRITHRNVCRIHDIAHLPEADGGDMFISMEYIDGDDLSTLLKRIGRLPQDKAVDVARQLCAALAAAHAEGVIHRDLKPSNIMLDGRGAVRLTDFGIAAIAEAALGQGEHTPVITGRDAAVGTPAYMAPEQYDGREVTASSDIYALGLVLYELLSGKRVWEASTHAELRALRGSTPAPALTASDHQDIDPALAALVDRCLEPDPRDRPASALAVAAALPGADPLAAALAAGETPSPELVAASGGRGVLAPGVAAAIASLSVVLVAVALAINARFSLVAFAGSPPPPPVMREAAIGIIDSFGHEFDPATPEQHGWLVSSFSTSRVAGAVREGDADWTALRSGINAPLRYWFRLEPGGFEPRTPSNRVWPDYPLRDAPGSILVQLDQNRALRSFTIMPEKTDTTPDDTEPDWSAAFALAGLDFSQYTPIAARRNPGNDPAVRRAWTGPAPADDIAGDPLRLNVYLAASDGRITDVSITHADGPIGRRPGPESEGTADEGTAESETGTETDATSAAPVHPTDQPHPPPPHPKRDTDTGPASFATQPPAETASPERPAEPPPGAPRPPERAGANATRVIQTSAQILLLGTITIVAGLLAYRNIRLKRGDVRRATRLGAAVFLLGALSSTLGADILPISLPRMLGPYPTWSASIGTALIATACYIAAEPLARSRWPGSLVSWTRLFSGRFSDPMIGRDTLIGLLAAAVIHLLAAVSPLLARAAGETIGVPPVDLLPTVLHGPRHVMALSFELIANGLFVSAAVALLLLLASLLLGLVRIRQHWPTLVIVTGLILLQQSTRAEMTITDRALSAVANLVVLFVLGKVGLLAAATTLAAASLLSLSANSTPFGDWWTTAAAVPLAALALLLLYSYRTSTAGRSIFAG